MSHLDRGSQSLSFRSSRIIYYGPHPCANCGEMIVKAGQEFGGSSFNQPSGPIYPNTEWHVHICDPKKAQKPSGAPIAERLSAAVKELT